jgi:hypothetical protein
VKVDAAEEREKHFETLAAIMLAVFAALLSLNDLASGKYEGDQVMAASEQVSAFNWYQSKSIKQSLMEGQHDTLEMLLASGAISGDKAAGMDALLGRLDEKIERYEREKTEILKGSSEVGEENWAQDVDGKMGQITGAMQWQKQAQELDAAGNVFDLANLFLQVCLVLGALCLVFQQPGPRRAFFWGMATTGVAGGVIAMMAYMQAIKVS